MSEEYDGKEFYLNQDLLPSTEEKLLELTALRKKGPETCLKSMRLGQEAILQHLVQKICSFPLLSLYRSVFRLFYTYIN